MSVPPNKIIRVTPPTGGIHALATNRDYTTGAGLLTDEDMSITTSGRLGVWMGHRMIVGEISDHGEVADEAAMLTLHDWPDDPHTRAVYHYVAPGDSCTRADDPGWRWHCISGHGQALSDWERRPLGGALDGYYTSSEVDDLLDGKQAALANAAALARITAVAGGPPKWDGGDWPGGGGSGGESVGSKLYLAFNYH